MSKNGSLVEPVSLFGLLRRGVERLSLHPSSNDLTAVASPSSSVQRALYCVLVRLRLRLILNAGFHSKVVAGQVKSKK